MIDYKQVGQRIASCRKKLGYKQYQVCEMINVNYKYLSNLETGRSAPSLDVILCLCNALNTTPNYILLGIDASNSEYPVDELYKKVNRLSPTNRKILIGLIDLMNENQ